MRDLQEKYGGLAQILFVYITDAGHEWPEALREIAGPADAPENARVPLVPRIRAGMEYFDLHFPCLLDNEQGEVERLYNAFPLRVLVVDSAGRIAIDSGHVHMLGKAFSWEKITDWLDLYSASLTPQSAEKRG